ncbi:MAG: serine/threonine-protein phosphatase [Acidobacteria bacterium]|nr:serine/threonine-protein phosphatase [Acidobacteriota bacterium]
MNNQNHSSKDRKVDVFGMTDVGCVRTSNEDCYVIQPLYQEPSELNTEQITHIELNGDLFVAVSDGMGGAAAGEVASSTALKTIAEVLLENESVLRESSIESMVQIVEDAIQKANASIFEAAQVNKAQKGMGATMTALYLRGQHAFCFQIGDSRAYVLRGDRFTKITRDQSFVGHLVEMGTITEEQAARHPQRNVILQAMGSADKLKVDVSYLSVCESDLFLLCTDGLYSELDTKELEEKVKYLAENGYNLAHKVNVLIDSAKSAGGHDNVTVVGMQFNGAYPAREPGEDPKFQPFPFTEEDNPFGKMFQIQN